MQRFETCNTVQTCIEHIHKENRFDLLFRSLLQNCVPLNDIHNLSIPHCNTVPVSATPTVFDAGQLKLSLQFRPAFGMCIKEVKF